MFVPEQDPHLLAEACMKYSLDYKRGYESADRSNYDVWTYPAQTGAEVLKEAFYPLLQFVRSYSAALKGGQRIICFRPLTVASGFRRPTKERYGTSSHVALLLQRCFLCSR